MIDAKNKAPDFTLPRDGGGTVSLSGLRPQAVVLYFYPRDDTSGCTRQAIGFTDLAAEFEAAGAAVVGVSKDSVASHDKFARKHRLGVILASDAEADICERYGVPPERVVVTPHGVTAGYRPVTDADRLAQARQRYGLERPFLLHVGKLQARKNLVRLVQAFKRGVVAAGLPHVLALVGPRTWMSDEIFEEIERQGVGDRVVVVGEVPVEDLPTLYSAAELFVFPSLAEGFGLPPLEAMTCGTAVMSSSASSLPEVVGDAGILVDPYDVNAMAEAMVEVLRDDGGRADLVARGLERASTFSNRNMAQLTMAAYEAALR